jgi:hypothetical protein
LLRSRDHCFDCVTDRIFGNVSLAELKSVAEDSNISEVITHLIDVPLRFFPESFEKKSAIMFGGENLWSFGVNFSVANPDLINLIHQLRDQIKAKACAPEAGNLPLGREDHTRIFNCVMEIIFGHDGAPT